MPARRLVAALALAAALPAAAGVVMEAAEDGATSVVQIEGNRMRVESKDGVMIFDGDAKRLYQLDPAHRNYREMTEGDLKDMRAELEKAVKEMPPEMRAQVEAQMGAGRRDRKPAVKWEKTGRSDKGLGRSCAVYREIVDGKPTGEVCVVPFDALGVRREDFQVFEAMADFVRSFGDQQAVGSVEWRDVPGMPVVTWDVDGGKRTEEFRATKLQKASVPADRFKPPAGWEKVPTR
jgi:hypothetical protein